MHENDLVREISFGTYENCSHAFWELDCGVAESRDDDHGVSRGVTDTDENGCRHELPSGSKKLHSTKKNKLDFSRVKMVPKTFMLTCKNPDRPQQIPPIIIPTTKALLTPIFGSFKEELYC